MTTPTSSASGGTPERAPVLALIDQLQASCSWKSTTEWMAYVCAVLYACVADLQGSQFFILYCGVLVVVFMLRASSEQRTRRQIDLLVQLARELEKKGRDHAAVSPE